MTASRFWPIRALKTFRKSIAYLPTLLALCYWVLGWLALMSPVVDEQMPGLLLGLRLDAPDEATTLLAALLGGMISLVVFSFSMVMSVLSQAGGQFSHKLVFGLVTERPRQWVLGHYLGTILFILMLLIVPGSPDQAALWRSLAIYLACGMVIHSLALYVFFIHDASQSIQVDAVASELHRSTLASMRALQARQRGDRWRHQPSRSSAGERHVIHARRAGYLQNADLPALARLARRLDGVVHLNFRFGDYVVQDLPILHIEAATAPSEEWCRSARATLTYLEGESVAEHYVHGLTQLMEMAVKALSPGIHDPGTARLCVHRLTDLLGHHLRWQACNTLLDGEGRPRVTWPLEGFDALLHRLFTPILHYGADDQSIGLALLKAVKSLSLFADDAEREALQAFAERVVEVLARGAGHPLDRQFIEARLAAGEHRLDLPARLPAVAPHAPTTS
ncbi:DUF2254 domain-containing protein [Halomonas nitroreducens]|uniref:DUF2254 domain-containing protein n=1 Tax=Halomonas nitroreducens TaxID=447425 RepID=A0A431V8Z2_9GAMM|nr:DUF2254 domain-containing protein [Halomonas nitroreducens]RTR07153.1 DUF2254 domain-containing protein [Halomonas nitroreducens]